jgi:magnesium chelatase subunit H
MAAERIRNRSGSGATGPMLRIVVVTMDTHLASATVSAARRLAARLPGASLEMHAASEFSASAERLAQCRAAIEAADMLVVTMLFMEEHFLPIIDLLQKRRAEVDAMVCAMSAPEVVRLTRLGRLDMSKPASGALAFIKRLRGSAKPGQGGADSGEKQMKMLRRLPRILRFIPGTAQDLRAYFICLQYWLGGSEDNMEGLAASLINRYASGPREGMRGRIEAADPVEYPEVGVYHPRMSGRISDDARRLPRAPDPAPRGTVGVLMLRSYLLAGNAAHYDGVINALEARGLAVIPAFATGLDSRPAVNTFFRRNGQPAVDAIVSLTGFSLVGGPAYNDSQAAEAMLADLDVPYLAAHPVEFQTLADWGGSDRGLLPVESTIMVAIPELDGATSPIVFGGRPGAPGAVCAGCDRSCRFDDVRSGQDMVSCPERADMLAARVARLVALRRKPATDRRVAMVLFNFPPNGGAVGSAAHLSVFESVHGTLAAMQKAGYRLTLPESPEALRTALLGGNASRHGTDANVLATVPVADHVRQERWLSDIEKCWGPAPGRVLTNGRELFVLGLDLGEVVIAVQPGFGYEGDPMRLLFEKGLAPTHAFCAFYRWLREQFRADALVHFGTHGALEFMPGKQVGASGACWPDRLVADLPNFYLYASNNPSEGTIAKRRSAATLVSYMTPPVAEAGLYAGLRELRQSIDRWRATPIELPQSVPAAESEHAGLLALIEEQALAVELDTALFKGAGVMAGQRVTLAHYDRAVLALLRSLEEMERTLIPCGLHVFGEPFSREARRDILVAMAQAHQPMSGEPVAHDRVLAAVDALIDAATESQAEALARSALGQGEAAQALAAVLARANAQMQTNHEIESLLRALEGRFIRPAPGGDVLRTPETMPTGRNLHGFDPFRMPSRFAVIDGARQVERLLARHAEEGHGLPETVAMVLWGTDNLKTEGGPIGQVLALLGAAPRFDSFGRLAGATLTPLAELGRPRIDVVVTLSGIFRDLLPLQIRMLAEAAFLAASADEPPELNFVRRHALAYMAEHGCDIETASLRVFGNADGAYGANVNQMIEQGAWQDEDELAETYTRRKGFAYGRAGKPLQQPALLQSVLQDVGLAYQNLDSIEVGVTTVDTYFDTLGGVTRAVRRAQSRKSKAVSSPTPGATSAELPVYIGDQTTGAGRVRTLSEQVALETRTRMLNPKWYEGMLAHGYEGVRQIEAHLTNTMGWSATTGQVQPWVYQQLTRTFMLDPAMRDRLAQLNPAASAKVANRLLEASERQYWTPDAELLEALRRAGEEFEDRIEGVATGAAP